MHGRFYSSLNGRDVDKAASTRYLTLGYLFPETEGFIHAIQDQVVPTRSYLKHIQGADVETEMCRLCGRASESIQHISSGCSVLAARDYVTRHNLVAKVIHQGLCKKYSMIDHLKPPHKYSPQWKQESDRATVYWDTAILTDKNVRHNRPDILVLEKKEKLGYIIDIAIPIDDNIGKSYQEKVAKYQDLAFELKQMYNLVKISVLPFIISSNGLVHKEFSGSLRRLNLDSACSIEAQKSTILGTCSIVRKTLQM